MTQVIDNILNNAIKYSPDGGKIKVGMKTTDAQLIISISDEGLGIPKKDLPRIFDRFTEWIRHVAGPKEGLVWA